MLETGDGLSLFVMVVGDDAALDFVSELYDACPEDDVSELVQWADSDARFCVRPPELAVAGRPTRVVVHVTATCDRGRPAIADAMIGVGAGEAVAEIDVCASDFDRPFAAWTQAIKLATMTSTASRRRTDVYSDAHGDAAIAASDVPPIVALTRISPGYRLAYAASYVDREVRNGGFAQLFWNGVESSRREVMFTSIDALHTLELSAGGQVVADALKLCAGQLGLLRECGPKGLPGFARFRDESGLARFDSPYWTATRELPRKLDEFVAGHPDDFSSPIS
jgi:hypothetical protein